mmetsp:Transcript_9875/g.13232  ORF Transcript_9875/g.13232 Transcript_9875/m.13232 type:complete len:111 (+) Transcript_9875:1374-1706(+)
MFYFDISKTLAPVKQNYKCSYIFDYLLFPVKIEKRCKGESIMFDTAISEKIHSQLSSLQVPSFERWIPIDFNALHTLSIHSPRFERVRRHWPHFPAAAKNISSVHSSFIH